MKLRVLDLFCGAGGAAMGYYRPKFLMYEGWCPFCGHALSDTVTITYPDEE